MEPEIGITQKPYTLNINERVAISELLEIGASWMGMVACWWATMLMQGGIFFTTLETKDCLFLIVIFLFICFRHQLYFCPQATWSLTKANRSLWTNNIRQLELPIGFISRLFYWCKLVSAIICFVLSMMRLVSQDFGKEKVENMAIRNFSLNVFYVLALIETVLLLVALVLQILFKRAKKEEKKEENKEEKKEEKEDEKKEEMEHEIIEIPDQTNICSEQQDSSHPMPNNNGDDTCHKLTGKITREKFNLILMAATLLRVVAFAGVVTALRQQDGIIFILKTKDHIFVTVMSIFICIRFFHFSVQIIRSVLANNIQQLWLPIGRPLSYRFQLVSAWTCFVLSMMGLVPQYSSQTEVMSLRDNLHFCFYYFALLEALMSLAAMRIVRKTTMWRTVTEALFEGGTDPSNNFRPNRRMELIKAPSEYPAEKCKQTEEMKAEIKKSQ